MDAKFHWISVRQQFGLATITCLAMCVVLFSRNVHAEVLLFDNEVETPNSGYTSDIGARQFQFIADDFTLERDSILTRIQWSGGYERIVEEDFFEIRFMRDLDPDPDVYVLRAFLTLQPTEVSRNDTGIDIESGGEVFDIFDYEAVVDSPDATLNGSERIFINIFNETGGNWFWGTDTTTGEMYYANSGTNGDVVPFESAMDFSLSGQQAVPESSPMVLLGAFGLLICVVRLHRMRSREKA